MQQMVRVVITWKMGGLRGSEQMIQSRSRGSNLAKISLSGRPASPSPPSFGPPTISAAICARRSWPGFSEQVADVFVPPPSSSALERLLPLLSRCRGGIAAAAAKQMRPGRFDVRGRGA